jgi:3-hydroxyacyl-CoA dehydrogenase
MIKILMSNGYWQECVHEELQLKREVHAKIDTLSRKDAIVSSSASALVPSLISENLTHKNRFIVCHPVRRERQNEREICTMINI